MGLLEWIALGGSAAGLFAWFHALDHARLEKLRDLQRDLAVLVQRVEDEVRRCDGHDVEIAEIKTAIALLRQAIESLRGVVDHNRNNCKTGGALVADELKRVDDEIDAIKSRLPRHRG